jgi:hypothetical protein
LRLTAPRIPEASIHRQIADVFAKEIAPAGKISREGVVWFSVDIAAYAGVAPGLRTTRGIVAGIPDCVILFEGRAYFIEIKAIDGRLSPAQCDVCASLLVCGAHYGVARNHTEALALVDAWGIPRAHRIRGP